MEIKYNELFTALAKAQLEMQSAGMNSQNPFFKSRYADFAEIVRASRPSLAANGLCVIQRIVTATDGMTLVTTLGHSSGQFIESEIRISPAKADVQSLGSYLSYIKRYQYAALCGVIVSDQDNDGESDMDRSTSYAPTYNKPEPVKDQNAYFPINSDQHDQLQMELKDHPKIAEMLLAAMNKKYPDMEYTKLAQLPKSDWYGILSFIKKNKDAIK